MHRPLIQINAALLLEEFGISVSRIARRGLRAFAEAERLEVAEIGEDGLEHLMVPEAAAAWRQLTFAARQDGIDLFVVSAYRSISPIRKGTGTASPSSRRGCGHRAMRRTATFR